MSCWPPDPKKPLNGPSQTPSYALLAGCSQPAMVLHTGVQRAALWGEAAAGSHMYMVQCLCPLPCPVPCPCHSLRDPSALPGGSVAQQAHSAQGAGLRATQRFSRSEVGHSIARGRRGSQECRRNRAGSGTRSAAGMGQRDRGRTLQVSRVAPRLSLRGVTADSGWSGAGERRDPSGRVLAAAGQAGSRAGA